MKKKHDKPRDEKEVIADSQQPADETVLGETKNYDELWDRHIRLQADFDNYRKRSLKERMEFVKYANEGLIMELLSILDNFELGIRAAEKKHDFELLHQGVDMIARQLHTLLEGKGLKRIKAVGEKFDPHLHEPLDVAEDDGVTEDTVCEELQPGYLLNGRIIRPAKVKVVRAKQVVLENDEAPNKEDQQVSEDEGTEK
jgi:molecular chaperone GrpE